MNKYLLFLYIIPKIVFSNEIQNCAQSYPELIKKIVAESSYNKICNNDLSYIKWNPYKTMLSAYNFANDSEEINCINNFILHFEETNTSYWKQKEKEYKCNLSAQNCNDENQDKCCYVAWNLNGIRVISRKNKTAKSKAEKKICCEPTLTSTPHTSTNILVEQIIDIVERLEPIEQVEFNLSRIVQMCSTGGKIPPLDMNGIILNISDQSERKLSGKSIDLEFSEILGQIKSYSPDQKKRLLENCGDIYFNLFMLQMIVDDSIDQISKESGFALGGTHKFPLQDVHQKFYHKKIKEFVRKDKCGYKPRPSGHNTELFPLKEVVGHPDLNNISIGVIDTCETQLRDKTRKYEEWLPVQKCDSVSHTLFFGDFKDTQIGNVVSKDLFCEAYRNYLILDLIIPKSKIPNKNVRDRDTFLGNGPFTAPDSPKKSCKYFEYHPKREYCYPK